MPDTITICTACENDAETIADFNVAMAWETERRRLDPLTVRRGVHGLMAHPDLGFYLVAVCGGRVVGSLMVTYEWSDWRNGCFWWVQSLYVHPDYRRRGVLRRLHAHLLERAKRDSTICGLRLYVERDNTVAQHAYVALGMAATSYLVYESDFAADRTPNDCRAPATEKTVWDTTSGKTPDDSADQSTMHDSQIRP